MADDAFDLHFIVLPAYNESERLAYSLPRFSTTCASRDLHGEIIVVNDGSTDNTAEVVRRFMAGNPDGAAWWRIRQSRQRLQRAQWHAARHRRCNAVHRR